MQLYNSIVLKCSGTWYHGDSASASASTSGAIPRRADGAGWAELGDL